MTNVVCTARAYRIFSEDCYGIEEVTLDWDELLSELKKAQTKFEEIVESPDIGLGSTEKDAIVSYLLVGEKSRLIPSYSFPFERLPFDFLVETIERLSVDPQDASPSVNGRGVDQSDGLQLPSIDFSESDDFDFIEVVTPEAERDEWGFHMTNHFIKSVKDLDRSMRGRVLDAITEICRHPMEVRGDTIKPLSGELSGCWRYRLGDYRLIYHPDREVRRIDLISIGGRGSVYVH